MKRKSSSLWGIPPTRFYNFLKRVEESFTTRPLQVGILGCSDGKFVLPAARRGHKVFAIDIDEVALFGGEKIGPSGKVPMPGLVARLKSEGVEDRVQVVHGDFVEHSPVIECQAVLTSGAVQYSRNLKHSMKTIIDCIQLYVRPGGYIYVDYMLPMEEKYMGRDNYPGREEWQQLFPSHGWDVLYNRVLPPLLEKAHVDNPIDHYHHWGHLLVRRK